MPATDLIVNQSFEASGTPSIEGWRFWTNLPRTTPEFSSDTPTGGGSWSVVLSVGDRVGASLTTSFPAPPGTHVYALEVWGKVKHNSGFAGLLVNGIAHKRATVTDTTWTRYLLIDTLTTNAGDTVGVTLSPGSSMMLTQAFFDCCRLVYYD